MLLDLAIIGKVGLRQSSNINNIATEFANHKGMVLQAGDILVDLSISVGTFH